MGFTKDELKTKRVAVLMGGLSSERDISLRTGAAVSGALKGLGYTVVEIDVDRSLAAKLLAEKIDVAFLALHGRYGEDGSIQGLLESMFIPYTGSGVLASAVAMEKVFAKQVFLAHGINTPRHIVYPDAATALAHAEKQPFPYPVVVKPSREGSSVGVHVCRDAAEFRAAIQEAQTHAGQLLVEQFVKGREVQGAVLDDEALGVIEVRPGGDAGWYDFNAKYKQGSGTQYLFPAPLPPEQYEQVNRLCLGAHKALGCSGATRSDVILTESGEAFLLEVNTLPGMTASSLLPKIAAGRGIEFPQLCERLLLGASLKG